MKLSETKSLLKDLRALSVEELTTREAELKKELFDLRFQAAAKTITVVVETKRNHPVYGKRINYSKKYKAHDENNSAKTGDIVRIMETRPLSKDKHFRLVEIVEEAVII